MGDRCWQITVLPGRASIDRLSWDIVIDERPSSIHIRPPDMPYSGADVLAQLSELARQRADLPQIKGVLILAHSATAGDLLQSAMRAVVGYDTRIEVISALSEVSQNSIRHIADIAFIYDEKPGLPARFSGLLAQLRRAEVACPVVVITTDLAPQDYQKLFDLGVTDIMNRDDICGLRLREAVLKLGARTPAP